MERMSEYPPAKRPATYASIIFLIGTTLTIIAFSTPFWLESDRKHRENKVFRRMGLWELCLHNFQTFGTVSTSSGSQQMQVATYGPINLGQYGNPYYSTWFCFWIFDPKYKFILNYIEQPFFVATQIIYTTGFCIALLCCLVLMTKCCIRNSYGDLVISMICGVLGIVSSICMLVAIIVFGVAAPYWGWVHDTGLGLGVPWIPKTPIYKVTPPQFPGYQNYPGPTSNQFQPHSRHAMHTNYLSWSFVVAICAMIINLIGAGLYFLDVKLMKKLRLDEEVELRIRNGYNVK